MHKTNRDQPISEGNLKNGDKRIQTKI